MNGTSNDEQKAPARSTKLVGAWDVITPEKLDKSATSQDATPRIASQEENENWRIAAEEEGHINMAAWRTLSRQKYSADNDEYEANDRNSNDLSRHIGKLPTYSETLSLGKNARSSDGCGVDLSRPLSHYWINSSHNTYLTGNQLCSTSGAEALERALRKGCRVIELDIFDGQKYHMSGPVVVHGGTACSPVLLETCLVAMRDVAFEVSDAPVIITLENHTSAEGQQQVASLLRSVLGDSLHIPRMPCFPNEWPAPKQLLRRFLVRVKATRVQVHEGNNAECVFEPSPRISCLLQEALEIDSEQEADVTTAKGSNDAQSPDHVQPAKSLAQRAAKFGAKTVQGVKSVLPKRIRKAHAVSSEKMVAVLERAIVQGAREATVAEAEPAVADELLQIVTIGNLDQKTLNAITTADCRTSTSFSDAVFRNKLKKRGASWWCKYTGKHLARVYPTPIQHLDSSNFDPQDAWEAGCQIVALNFQGGAIKHNIALWINAGKFRANGGCGYVPKPQHLLPPANDHTPSPRKAVLRVKVLRARSLQLFQDADWFSDPDFLVTLTVAGAKEDRCTKKTSVRTPPPNHAKGSLTVNWEEDITFDISEIELAVLLIQLWDHDAAVDDFLGQNAFPVLDLPCVNHIPLLSNEGDPLKSEPMLECSFDLEVLDH